MNDIIQLLLLSQWTVLIILMGVFVALSRWVIFARKELQAYGLGILIALFFVVVYAALGGGTNYEGNRAAQELQVITIVLMTFFGLVLGGAVLVGLRYGRQYARGFSLQIAVYTALNIILLFIALIEEPATRAIGIFALAFGIATLFGMMMFGQSGQNQAEPENPQNPMSTQTMNAQNLNGTQSFPPVQANKRATSRLDQIREAQAQKDQRRDNR